MNLEEFKAAVDACPDEITAKFGSLEALYEYVGLPLGNAFSRDKVAEELYSKIKGDFSAGRQTVWKQCREFCEELIQDEVLDGAPLDPYFAVLEHLKDAVRGDTATAGDIVGDWQAAIRHAYDHVRLRNANLSTLRESTYARQYELARAAKRLRDRGYQINRSGHYLFLEPESELKLVQDLEAAVAQMSGLNIARRSFTMISKLYSKIQERYYLIKRPSMTGGGKPQIPFGYILSLAAKHCFGRKPLKDTDLNWNKLLRLASDYAAVFDVQEYAPSVWRNMDAIALISYLREVALFDTIFCLPQIRSSNVEAIARGILGHLDFDEKRGGGWSLNDVLAVIEVILETSKGKHEPQWFDVGKISSARSDLAAEAVAAVFAEVLSHPKSGANRRFSKPTDAPTDAPDGRSIGQTFYTRPLLTANEKQYWLLDRSMCSTAYLEAILGAIRSIDAKLDQRLGATIETFLRDTFHALQIPTVSGDYDVDGEHGECDIIVETEKVIVFFEIKKKPFTRRAQAGSDAHVLLDLADSVVAAQAQAGWHEVRLRKHGFLDLDDKGKKYRLELKGRSIERIAVSLLQYGGFQDRIFLKQLLEGTLNSSFASPDAALHKKMTQLNSKLAELRDQLAALHPGEQEVRMPFFHCWFLSIPQLLVLLDGVTSPEEFKTALWQTRSLASGTSDFYHDLALCGSNCRNDPARAIKWLAYNAAEAWSAYRVMDVTHRSLVH